jgi:hypothetical protein
MLAVGIGRAGGARARWHLAVVLADALDLARAAVRDLVAVLLGGRRKGPYY